MQIIKELFSRIFFIFSTGKAGNQATMHGKKIIGLRNGRALQTAVCSSLNA